MDLAQVKAAHAPAVRELPGLRIWLWHDFDAKNDEAATARTAKHGRPIRVR